MFQIYYCNQKLHIIATLFVNRGPYMSAHVLLNLLNELGKKTKRVACVKKVDIK